MTSDFIVAIPARYKSSRLPGKPLKDINGKAMIHRVWDICVKAVGKENSIVLTDNNLIRDYCYKNNIKFYMTSPKCKTGTDRIYEFSKKNKYKYYINVQGDEPLLNPNNILSVVNLIKRKDQTINCYSDCTMKEYKDINIPKVVVDEYKNLVYMSRAPIPSSKINLKKIKCYKQICIYGYTLKDLKLFGKKLNKTKNEKYEDIEILRLLDMGVNIKMLKLKSNSIAVDTLEDLKKVRKVFESKFKKY